MNKPRLLDLFCCAGGATRGYQMAGFHVTGIDIKRQPRYIGDVFYQADALEFVAAHGDEFDAIHASPPCQFGSEQTPMQHRSNHPNLIPQTRELLQASGKPYIIENVENVRSHLINPIMLCGTMFGLPIWRHRYFEMWPARLLLTPSCNHSRRPVTFTSGSHSRALNRKMSPVLISGTTPRSSANGGRFEYTVEDCRQAAQIPWMTRAELDEAIPPAYTRWIGERLLEVMGVEMQECIRHK